MNIDEALRIARGWYPAPGIAGPNYRTAILKLADVAEVARRYSVATRDPGGETDDERRARHRECNQAWRDLNDALART